ncbi:MAG: iron chelate uptake ABC transporter family permease subunit [Clostridia bacterium]|nr:iron chelate uptake ABC transporter family permease subunit [Clostridia bacterium]
MIICLFLPAKINILMLGDEAANSLGLRTELFRFFLICVSSLLAGAAISVSLSYVFKNKQEPDSLEALAFRS